jgi:3-oxoacyl-[acyl-carrier protein] reductase
MDLGLKGRSAIICASSKGLGKGCAMALAEAGCNVVINGRDEAVLQATAAEIVKATGVSVTPVVGDMSSEEGRARLLAACPSPDILVNNNGGPPPKEFSELTKADILAGLEANMLAPIALVQAVVEGMIARRFGRIIDITSASVKMPLPGLDVSSGARAGLTAFLAGIARQIAQHNVTINHILPGVFDTDRIKQSSQRQAERRGMTTEAIIAERAAAVPARRLGRPDEFGALCAFLASSHASYITGQNFLIDGGLFNSAF